MAISDQTHVISMTDIVSISMERPKVDSEYPLEKEPTRLICINPNMILYLSVNHVN